MTPLRQQMHDAMLVRGLAERTRQTYIENVARLAIFYRQNPADLTPEQVEAWLLHLVRDRKLSYSTLNQAAAACRFFYGTVLKRERAVFPAYSSESPTQTTGMLPPKPVKAATPSERSDAGGLFLLYLASCRQICLLFSE